MHRYTSDIITVCFKRMNAFQRIIIKHSNLHVIGTSDNPVLAWHKFGSPYRQIAYFECFHQGLRLVIPDIDIALIQGAQHPWLGWMKIHTLYSV